MLFRFAADAAATRHFADYFLCRRCYYFALLLSPITMLPLRRCYAAFMLHARHDLLMMLPLR